MFDSKEQFIAYLRKTYNKSLLTKKEAANELSISTETLDRMRRNGELKSVMVNKQVRIKLSEIARVVMS